ncbi:MAG: hypothetical protein IKL00_05575 [Oscillospiraceae bacterium]|nr:hypothetical protein [Oscillospiraceae bacterium]
MELTIAGCRIRLDFGFPAMLAILYLHADGQLLLQTLSVCMLHEIGHGIAMILTGAGIREVHLHAAGMQMRTYPHLLSKPRELAVLLSGPLVNFLASWLLYFCFGWCDAAVLHLGMGLFNLLPFSVLDGGSAIACLSEGKPCLLRMQTVLCSYLSASAVIFALYFGIRNPCIYLMCIYLSVAQLKVDKQGGMW